LALRVWPRLIQKNEGIDIELNALGKKRTKIGRKASAEVPKPVFVWDT
jgi:hypothetical protein